MGLIPKDCFIPLLISLVVSFSASSAETDSVCSPDPTGYAKHPYVSDTIKYLKLDDIDIYLIGCTKGRFQTKMAPRGKSRKKAFAIYYTVPTASVQRELYTAPIIHELGHIYQIKLYGSFGALRDAMCIERIELGADFIAAFVFTNALKQHDLSRFQTNLELRGNFTGSSTENHGNPAERTSAFRTGHFFSKVHGSSTMADAYDYFQAVSFSSNVKKTNDITERCLK